MNELKQKFEKICESFGVVGASACIFKNNQVTSLNYGYATDSEVTKEDTIYRIASISKIIVALAAMKLVEEKRLDLDEDISVYLGFKLRNIYHPDSKITTRMLMTQTSSITDGFDDEDMTNDEARRDTYNGVNGTFLNVTLEDLLIPNASVYYNDITFDKNVPGTKFIYSNFGCGILACIVERISGEYFTDYIRRILLKPLGLDASFRIDDIEAFDKVSSTYIPKNGEMVLYRTKERFLAGVYPRFEIGQNYRGPAGGLFISAKDLSVIMQMMINRGEYHGIKVFEKETIELMFVKNWEGHDENYRAKGLQMIIFDNLYGHKLYGHFGSAYGVRSFMLFDKDEKVGMCFIANGLMDHSYTDGSPNIHLKVLELINE
ncbi:MAG: beta-lactamase family protein [Bacilli bacterium]|nr:beta-lactamase family protein [Bacilli bacterium]